MKRALVTGGSGNIGAEICYQLSKQKLHVIVHANTNQDQAQNVCQRIVNEGGSAEAISFDITDDDLSKTKLEKLLSQGAIQVLINNAGAHDDATMAGMTSKQWKRIIDINLNGFFNITQPLLLPMIRTRWGRIINISSVAAILGNLGQTNYAAAKAGLHGATKSLAIEVASRGITVNTVAPGIITTDMTENVFSKEQIEAFVPMKRAGLPEEVASLVDFLASEKASYISGQIISINGAMA